MAFKKPKGGRLTLVQQQLNKALNGIRAIGERGHFLLKITFKFSHTRDRFLAAFDPPAHSR